MRTLSLTATFALLVPLASLACSGASNSGFLSADGGTSTGTGTGTGIPPFNAGSGTGGTLSQVDAGAGSGTGGATVTTIYADTDSSLYTLDPATNAVTLIGAFSGWGGGSGDTSATDVAVNAAGDVYVNSQSAVYKAVLPAAAGPVTLTNRLAIALSTKGSTKQSFYALAFAPAGVLGAGETLVGGDNTGELWSIDPASGATRDLGNFGANPSKSGYILGVSGDIVFYTNAAGQPTGLATIRSCKPGGSSCTSTDDYLAGIDMAALSAAYTSGTPAASLLTGVYGGGVGSVGPGTGFGELFGLGAWEGTVFGFGHSTPELVTINTSTGAGTLVSSAFSSGWAGAGVSTKTTITVAAPPAAK